MKRCNDCGVSKSNSAYTKQKQRNGTYGLASVCKGCACQVQASRYKQETPEQKLSRRDKVYRRLYGITIQQYNQIFTDQQGNCASCSRNQAMFKKSLVVDHCHATKKVRGLLCSGCNIALGNIQEVPERLEALATYIRKHK